MGAIETYAGGCHCGRVRYEVKLDLEKPVMSCNCSMCGRSGTLLSFVPATEFTLKTPHTPSSRPARCPRRG